MTLVCALESPALLAQSGKAEPPVGELRTAQQALAHGDFGAAESHFRRLAVQSPDDPDILLGWAAALAGLGRRADAIGMIERAAGRRLRRDDESAAETLIEGALERLGDDIVLLRLLGEARIQARRYLSAEQALRRAHELGARDPETLLLLAASLWENARPEEAEAVYRQLLEHHPTLGVAHVQLARLLSWQGRYREAISHLDRARALGFSGPIVATERARALLGASRSAESAIPPAAVVEAFTKAIELSPGDYQLHYGLAQALARAGDREAAEREMLRFRALYEEHQQRTRTSGLLDSVLAEARSRLRGEDPQAALEALEGAPEHPDVLRLRALAYEASGDLDAAITALEKAIAAAPERADLRVALARLRRARG